MLFEVVFAPDCMPGLKEIGSHVQTGILAELPVRCVCIWGMRMVVRAPIWAKWEWEVRVPSVPAADVKSSQTFAIPWHVV